MIAQQVHQDRALRLPGVIGLGPDSPLLGEPNRRARTVPTVGPCALDELRGPLAVSPVARRPIPATFDTDADGGGALPRAQLRLGRGGQAARLERLGAGVGWRLGGGERARGDDLLLRWDRVASSAAPGDVFGYEYKVDTLGNLLSEHVALPDGPGREAYQLYAADRAVLAPVSGYRAPENAPAARITCIEPTAPFSRHQRWPARAPRRRSRCPCPGPARSGTATSASTRACFRRRRGPRPGPWRRRRCLSCWRSGGRAKRCGRWTRRRRSCAGSACAATSRPR